MSDYPMLISNKLHSFRNFSLQNNEAILGPLIDNYFYRFKFKEIKIKLYDEVKESKKGRILQPFIRHITERYALYIQRQALPRIPNQAVLDRCIKGVYHN